MNQTIQSFFLKTILVILIINVTLCRSCYKLGCAASCYYSNRGFGYGYCEKDSCMCSIPAIYLFNGIGRSLNDVSIDLWRYNNHNKNLITTTTFVYDEESEMSSAHTSNKNKRNKIWEEIETKITKQYPFIKKENLQNLKAKIIRNQSALNYFNIHLNNPLKDALKLMEKKKPDTSKECDELLELLLKQENLTASSLQSLPLKQNTSVKNSTTSSPKNSVTKSTKPEKDNDLTNKTKPKQSVVEEEEENKHEIYYEVETVEYSDESEEISKKK